MLDIGFLHHPVEITKHYFVSSLGEEAGQLCIRLAVNQAQSSSSLSSYLSSLLSPAVFMGLGVSVVFELNHIIVLLKELSIKKTYTKVNASCQVRGYLINKGEELLEECRRL